MALHLHRATRTDLLAEGLAEVLAQPPADPFAQELVIVGAQGVERWLTQRLSHRLGAAAGEDGVCAGVRFLTPKSLLTVVTGTERDDPWLPDHLVWPLLATIDASLGESWAAQLAHHLGADGEGPPAAMRTGRRYSVARRIAGLFHAYAVQRPALLRDWASVGPEGPWRDGAGGDLDADLAWQPPLWRAVGARIGGPNPVQTHDMVLARLRAGAGSEQVPARVSLFGHTRLARSEVELLQALGDQREVHIWLPHPSAMLWRRLADTPPAGPIPRADDRSVIAVEHPLLISLGRDVRELQRTLAGADARDEPPLVDVLPLAEEPAGTEPPRTWLGWLQADLQQDRLPAADEAAGRGIDVADGSIQVHACHGPVRQVEVLREAIVALLAADPTLQPRDIIIMCPDVETFAPLIQAAFGLADLRFDAPAHPGHQMRVQLADRALINTNPLIDVAARLVALAAGRASVSELLDLAAAAPVRRKFAFDDKDLDRITTWSRQAAIRWGLDGEHRGDYLLEGESANTWYVGLTRLLLGVTREEDPTRRYDRVLPLDDVDSGEIDLVGALVEFVERFATFRADITAARTAAEWMGAIREAVAALAEVPLDEAWQRAELDRELALVTEASGGDLPLTHSDIRIMLQHRLGGRATRANFRTGALTVCTMVPMRSVPHRVIALLGLDDGVFPRSANPDGDDVLARRPLTGERDPRSEDRQLLLDAITAARDALIVTYSGADPHTGALRPPAVPLGEVIDAARASAGLRSAAPGATPVAAPVRRHRLQSFDPIYLDGSDPGAFTFDPYAEPAARALRTARRAGGAQDRAAARGLRLPSNLLPAAAHEDLSFEALRTFFANPARGYLRDRLDVAISAKHEEISADIPIAPDGLETWAIGERLLARSLSGAEIEDRERAERQRGELPPGWFGVHVLRDAGPRASRIAANAQHLLPEAFAHPATTIDVDVDLGDGRRLSGSVDRVRGRAFTLVTYSSLSGKHRLEAWIALLALTAGTPDTGGPWQAHVIGRYGKGPKLLSLGNIAPDEARSILRDLVAVRDLGLRGPLPFAPKTSFDYAKQLYDARGRHESKALEAARARFERFHDNNDPALAALYGATPRLDIWLDPPAPEELWPPAAGKGPPVPSRFGHTAMRVWHPALTRGAGA